MKEFEPNIPTGFVQLSKNTTTLVIEDVPSDVAWKFITGEGKDLSVEEQHKQLIKMFEGSPLEDDKQLENDEQNVQYRKQYDIFTLETCEYCNQPSTRIRTKYQDLNRIRPSFFTFTEEHNFVWENTLVGDTIVEVSQCSDCGLINGYRVNDQVFKTEEEMKTAFPELFEVQEETIGHSHSL